MYLKDEHKVWLATGEKRVYLEPSMANRHGLIAGATGTGKTVTLKVLAESFSDMGVPVFVVIYSLVTNLVVKKLRRNDLPWELEDYKELDYIDPATLQVVKKASVRREELAREKALKQEKSTGEKAGQETVSQ